MENSSVRPFRRTTVLTLVMGGILILSQPGLWSQNSAASYGFASSIPSASLADPTGKSFNISSNHGRPTVMIVTVPNMSQGSIQQDWVNGLGSLSNQVNFYLVEDMKGTMFQSIALGDMKSAYSEGDRPVVLIDSDGAVRKQLGTPKGRTCVMIFNSNNRLIYVQVGNASSTAVQKVNQAIAGLTN